MKSDYASDERLEAMLSKLRIAEPKLFCDQRRPIIRMCINPACKRPSLICEEDECPKCGDQNHLQCSTIKFKAVTKLLIELSEQQKEFVFELSKIENDFIDQLHKTRVDLTQKSFLGKLSENHRSIVQETENHRSIVQEIFKKKNTKCMTGKAAEDLIKKLRANKYKAGKSAKCLIQTFRQSMKQQLAQINNLRSLIDEYFWKDSELLEVDSNILKNPYSSILKNQIFKSSTIESIQFLTESLKNPQKIELLYRASENNFSAAAFHQKCDNYRNTLTIVRTEFGKTIADFTFYPWNHANGYVNDSGRHFFLLSLDLKKKMMPVSDQYLIYCKNTYGPTFGDGYDLYISDQCHNNTKSYASFPYSYNGEGAQRCKKNQDSYQAFSGATNGSSFRVVEYEVFKIVYQQVYKYSVIGLNQCFRLYSCIYKPNHILLILKRY